MLSLVSVAPYATVLGLVGFMYFVVGPFVGYIRDPKGLRRYPNMNFFSGMSAVPFMILASRGFRSKELHEMHRKKPIIRTGPNMLSYGDVRAIKDIYGHNTRCIKDPSYVVTSGTHYNLADVVDRPDHSCKRKVLSSAYALKNLEAWEYKVSDKIDKVVAHFDKVCTAPPTNPAVAAGTQAPDPSDLTVDFRAWTNFFSLDAIADIGLSEKLGFLDTGSDVCIAERKDGSTYEVNLRQALYPTARKQSLILWNYEWYPTLNKLVNVIPWFNRMQKSSVDWENIVWRRSMERLRRYEAGEKLEDFFQALMEDKNGRANNLEWGEVVAEMNIMMNAGSVTTAIAIANVMYQLLRNPACLRTLREELDAVLDPDEIVAPYDKIKHLPYLRACLDESLRIFPPTSHGLPRETPPEGMEILGQWVPGNTSVSMSAYVAHHDERAFPKSDQYIPERWLGEEGKALQPYFVAFSAGARSCIGRNISYLEQTKVLATVVHRYEFALPHPGWELKRLETMNLILGDMPVKVWRRTDL
ncbi:cytochrome P450 [Aspergillus affinis]|uniref:cytochrome P450 n=1 Tax=Aspergillus affinis TaxID=1070780 RepID=UPI0022FDC6A2|nr:putative cytochrome P450 monooxygenase [Aspergillus affinis]KAI9035235.1 putative cytochrome P450 monooxygenase [Aspergillus affinis]